MFSKEVIHKLPDRKLGIYIYIYIYIFFFFFLPHHAAYGILLT